MNHDDCPRPVYRNKSGAMVQIWDDRVAIEPDGEVYEVVGLTGELPAEAGGQRICGWFIHLRKDDGVKLIVHSSSDNLWWVEPKRVVEVELTDADYDNLVRRSNEEGLSSQEIKLLQALEDAS